MSRWRFQKTWLDFPETRTTEDVGLPVMADCGGILKVLVFQKRMRVGSTEEEEGTGVQRFHHRHSSVSRKLGDLK